MKLMRLYLAEDPHTDVLSEGLGQLLKAVAKGIGKAALALGSIIYHGLLGKAVAAGDVEPKDARNALRMHWQQKNKEKQDEIRKSRADAERQKEQERQLVAIQQLREEILKIDTRLEELGGSNKLLLGEIYSALEKEAREKDYAKKIQMLGELKTRAEQALKELGARTRTEVDPYELDEPGSEDEPDSEDEPAVSLASS